MSVYRPILRQAWRTCWQARWLWFFAFFATLLGVGGEVSKIFLTTSGRQGILVSLWQTTYQAGLFSLQTLRGFGVLITKSPFSFIMILIIFLTVLGLFLLVLWLAIVSQAGLIDSLNKLNRVRKISFNQSLSLGIGKFWPVLGLNALLKIITLILVSILGWLTIKTGVWGTVSFIALFIIFIFIFGAISFSLRYSIIQLVIKGTDFIKSIKLGIKLFFDNWLATIELAVILFGIRLAALIITVIVNAILLIPFFFILLTAYFLQLTFAVWLAIILAVFSISAVSLFFIIFFTIFYWTSWVLLFGQLTEKSVISKLIRMTTVLPR